MRAWWRAAMEHEASTENRLETATRSSFWRRFVAEYWEQRPLVFPLVEPISAGQVFLAVKRACQRYREDSSAVRLTVSTASAKLINGKKVLLPGAEDDCL